LGLFNKKVKKKKEVKGIHQQHIEENYNLMFKVNEIPNEALNIIYSEKMKQYEETKDDNLHRDLCIIWKYLRADSNSEYYDFFEKKGISRKVIDQSNPKDLERMKNSILEADKALKDLSQPSEIEAKVDEIVKEKIAQDRKKIIKGKNIDWVNRLIRKEAQASVNLDHDPNMQTLSDPPKEKPIPEKPSVKPFEYEIADIPEVSNYKVEEAVPLDNVEVNEESVKQFENKKDQLKKLEQSANKIKKLTEEKERMEKDLDKLKQKPKKTGGFFTKKVVRVKSGVPDKPLLKTNPLKQMIKKKRKGINIEGMEELICVDCTHYLKNHQKQGVNSGCNKCGCLVTVQEIIESHGLTKISKHELTEPTARVIEEEPTIIVPQTVPPEIAKQAQQLQTLMPKDNVPKAETEKMETVRDKVTVDDCTCGHDKDQHYESRFCLADCDCSKFTTYANEKAN